MQSTHKAGTYGGRRFRRQEKEMEKINKARERAVQKAFKEASKARQLGETPELKPGLAIPRYRPILGTEEYGDIGSLARGAATEMLPVSMRGAWYGVPGEEESRDTIGTKKQAPKDPHRKIQTAAMKMPKETMARRPRQGEDSWAEKMRKLRAEVEAEFDADLVERHAPEEQKMVFNRQTQMWEEKEEDEPELMIGPLEKGEEREAVWNQVAGMGDLQPAMDAMDAEEPARTKSQENYALLDEYIKTQMKGGEDLATLFEGMGLDPAEDVMIGLAAMGIHNVSKLEALFETRKEKKTEYRPLPLDPETGKMFDPADYMAEGLQEMGISDMSVPAGERRPAVVEHREHLKRKEEELVVDMPLTTEETPSLYKHAKFTRIPVYELRYKTGEIIDEPPRPYRKGAPPVEREGVGALKSSTIEMADPSIPSHFKHDETYDVVKEGKTKTYGKGKKGKKHQDFDPTREERLVKAGKISLTAHEESTRQPTDEPPLSGRGDVALGLIKHGAKATKSLIYKKPAYYAKGRKRPIGLPDPDVHIMTSMPHWEGELITKEEALKYGSNEKKRKAAGIKYKNVPTQEGIDPHWAGIGTTGGVVGIHGIEQEKATKRREAATKHERYEKDRREKGVFTAETKHLFDYGKHKSLGMPEEELEPGKEPKAKKPKPAHLLTRQERYDRKVENKFGPVLFEKDISQFVKRSPDEVKYPMLSTRGGHASDMTDVEDYAYKISYDEDALALGDRPAFQTAFRQKHAPAGYVPLSYAGGELPIGERLDEAFLEDEKTRVKTQARLDEAKNRREAIAKEKKGEELAKIKHGGQPGDYAFDLPMWTPEEPPSMPPHAEREVPPWMPTDPDPSQIEKEINKGTWIYNKETGKMEDTEPPKPVRKRGSQYPVAPKAEIEPPLPRFKIPGATKKLWLTRRPPTYKTIPHPGLPRQWYEPYGDPDIASISSGIDEISVSSYTAPAPSFTPQATRVAFAGQEEAEEFPHPDMPDGSYSVAQGNKLIDYKDRLQAEFRPKIKSIKPSKSSRHEPYKKKEKKRKGKYIPTKYTEEELARWPAD